MLAKRIERFKSVIAGSMPVEDLGEKDREMYDRLWFIDDLLRKHGTAPSVWKVVHNNCREKFNLTHAYGQAQVLADIQVVQAIVGTTSRVNRDWHKSALLEKIEKQMNKLSALLDPNENFDEKKYNVWIKLMDRFITIAGLDRDEMQLPAFEDIGAHPMIIKYDPSLVRKDRPKYDFEALKEKLLSDVISDDWDLEDAVVISESIKKNA